ncbi:MAG: hypothetical protein P1P90_01255 [Patescibacteria group bacterium]|nr:hypothetical protein [Patescibacteria group bacterium]
MEQIIAQKQVKRVKVADEPSLTEAGAQMMTLGGTLILATTIILTLVLILSLFFPRGNGLQFVIIIALTIVGWGFFINCATERLSIKENQLIFKSLIGKAIRIDIANIDSYKLTNYGLRLDGNMYLIEIEHDGKDQPEEIWLSPCWKSKDLSLFCNTLGRAMEDVNI